MIREEGATPFGPRDPLSSGAGSSDRLQPQLHRPRAGGSLAGTRRSPLEENVDLADASNYRTGGVARWFVRATEEQDFVVALEFARTRGLPWFVLGGGTNTLIQDQTFEGIVISTTDYEARTVAEGGRIRARAGTTLRTLIGASIAAGLEGLETFIGIPGTIGGAVWGNAGGAGEGIGTLVESLRILEPDGEIHWVEGSSMPWRYRSSGLGERTVLEVCLELTPGGEKRELRAKAIELYERKSRTQPLHARSAGCVFRNPPGESAGRLIEAAGWKGRALGRARVSDRHANFIVNEGGATAAEIAHLIDEVQHAVASRFGVWLRREIIVASDRPDPRAEDPRSDDPRTDDPPPPEETSR